MGTQEKIEAIARRSYICPACGQAKDLGCVVCWGCWRDVGREDVPGWKYCGQDLLTWLRSMGRDQAAEVIEKEAEGCENEN